MFDKSFCEMFDFYKLKLQMTTSKYKSQNMEVDGKLMSQISISIIFVKRKKSGDFILLIKNAFKLKSTKE